MSTQDTDAGRALRMLALTGQYDELEDAWLEHLEGELRPRELLDALEALHKRGEGQRVRTLGAMALGPLVRAGHGGPAVAAARLMAEAPGEDDAETPDLVIEAYRCVYGDRPEADGLLRKALVYRSEGLAVLLRNLDAMFHFRQGDIVHHAGGWGYGRVRRIQGRREELTVAFRSGKENIFQLLSATEYLRVVAADSFEGLRFAEPERLRKLAAEDPLALLRLVLRGRGRSVSVRALKDMLVPDVLEPKEVTPWWGRARARIKYDDYLELEGGANGTLRLGEEPHSLGETMLRELTHLHDYGGALRKVRAYVGESKSHIEADVLRRMLDRLRLGAGPECRVADRAGFWFLVRRVREKGFDPGPDPAPLEEVVRDEQSFLAALDGLVIQADQNELLDFAVRAHPRDWPSWFEKAFELADLHVWDRIARTLLDAGRRDALERAFARVTASPKDHPLAFLWFYRSVLQGRFPGFEPDFDDQDLTEKALILTNKVRMAEELPSGVTTQKVYLKARDILTEKHFRSLFDAMEAPDAKRLIDFISGSGLRRSFAEVIEQIGISKFPEIVQKKDARRGPDASVLYTTARAFRRKQEEYEKLIHQDMEKNRIALGKAIAMGDLSENAELDAAREMQAQLSRKATEMEADMRRARILDPAYVADDRCDVGNGVEVVDAEGRRSRFLLLGPWDVDDERGVISYSAPLGQAFYGREPGETFTVELPGGEKTYTVERILGAADFGVDLS